MTIWKFPIEITDRQTINVGALIVEVLSVHVQREVPCVWILVDDNKRAESQVQLFTYGTGWPIPSGTGDYVKRKVSRHVPCSQRCVGVPCILQNQQARGNRR